MIGLFIILVYNSRLLSDALGFGIARKRKLNRTGSKILQTIISLAAWAIAIEILIFKCGGIFCTTPRLASAGTSQFASAVSDNQTLTKLPLLEAANQFSSLVQSNWFAAAFLGVLVISSVIVARGIIISWEETRAELRSRIPVARQEIIDSVEDALHILKAQPDADPRTRIINCYQRMVQAAQRLGASVTSDQTARELEAAIRMMLGIKGSSMRELTDLFEEARYSLHPITEDDAEQAQHCLFSIAEEMNIKLSV